MNISIITINFNDKKGLDKTIQSILSQTYSDYEYIVIDGGSTDGSIDVIKKYEDRIDYWVSENDSGIYNAMNKGIQKATGEYLHFLNSGDCYYNCSVLNDIFFQKSYSEKLIRGNLVFDEKPKEIVWENFGYEDITFYQMFKHTFAHQATFIHKQLFELYGSYNESYKICSDWLFFCKCILENEKTTYIPINICLFDVSGVSMKNRQISLEERKKAIKEILPNSIIEDYERLSNIEQQIKNIHQDPLYNFMKGYKLPNTLVRILRKTFGILSIDKYYSRKQQY